MKIKHLIGLTALATILTFTGCGLSGEANTPTDIELTGAIDQEFGNDGLVSDGNYSGEDGYDSGNGITFDPVSNRLYVVGISGYSSASGKQFTHKDMLIVSYESNGSLNTDFNGTGFVSENNASGLSTMEQGLDIVFDTNRSKIYAIGDVLGNGMILKSYDTNGSLDFTFGNNGIVVDNNVSTHIESSAYGIAIDYNNSKIFVSGQGLYPKHSMAIWSFDMNGTLNNDFNNSGIVWDRNASGNNLDNVGNAIAIYNDKIYVTGAEYNGSLTSADYSQMALWCYELNGTKCSDFGDSDGVVNNVATDYNASGANIARDFGSDIKIVDDKIYIVGQSGISTSSDIVVWKYDLNGSKDSSFGNDGVAVFDSGVGVDGSFYYQTDIALEIDSKGKIIVTGMITNQAGAIRFNTDGSLDVGFGINGYLTYGNGLESNTDAVLTSDPTRLYIVGRKYENSDNNIAIRAIK